MKASTYDGAVEAQWVMTKLTGARAKSALDHADASVGYHILERPDNGTGWATVAFRRPMTSPCPEGVSPVMNPNLISKLDRLHQQRTSSNGVPAHK